MSYFNRDQVKRQCGIALDDTTYDNDITLDWGPKADKDVDNDLRAYASVIPLAGAELVTETQTELANLKTTNQYAFSAHDEFLYDKSAKKYKEVLETFVSFLKSIPTTRTKAVLIAKDPRDIKTPLPTQSGIFAFDDYA